MLQRVNNRKTVLNIPVPTLSHVLYDEWFNPELACLNDWRQFSLIILTNEAPETPSFFPLTLFHDLFDSFMSTDVEKLHITSIECGLSSDEPSSSALRTCYVTNCDHLNFNLAKMANFDKNGSPFISRWPSVLEVPLIILPNELAHMSNSGIVNKVCSFEELPIKIELSGYFCPKLSWTHSNSYSSPWSTVSLTPFDTCDYLTALDWSKRYHTRVRHCLMNK